MLFSFLAFWLEGMMLRYIYVSSVSTYMSTKIGSLFFSFLFFFFPQSWLYD